MVIHHNPRLSARLENTQCLTYTLRSIGAVMDHSVGIHHVEGVVGKGQLLGVRNSQISVEPRHLATLARPFDGCRRQIYAGGLGSGLQPFEVVGPHSDTDLQYPQPATPPELCEVENERLKLIPRTRMRVEILPTLEIAASAWLSVPKFSDIFLSGDT